MGFDAPLPIHACLHLRHSHVGTLTNWFLAIGFSPYIKSFMYMLLQRNINFNKYTMMVVYNQGVKV